MSGSAEIVRADALALPLADASVDLVVTSPPYFGLRSYQDDGKHYDGQIGDEATPAEFVDALIAATREMVRVLKPHRSIWVNLGDRYNAYNGNRGAGQIQDNGPRPTLPTGSGLDVKGIRPKSLIGVPWRYAIRCIDDLGLILRAEVIWSKPNGLPESVTDRVRRSHEQWFHFTLSPRYYSAVDEIREEHASEPGREGRGALGGQKSLRPVGPNSGAYNPLGKLPGSVWTIATEPLHVPDELGVDHFAAFPTEWPRRIIQGWSPRGICTECGEGRRPAREGEWHFQVPGHEVGRRALRKAEQAGVTAEIVGTIYGTKTKLGGNHSDRDRNVHPEVKRLAADFGITLLSASGAMAATKRRLGGYVCACPEPTAPTRPGVVLDPFGGTGTTALVASALGRHGISNDLSRDYLRIAAWRTSDPKQIAKAKREPFTPRQEPIDGQLDILSMLEGEAS